MGNTNMDPVVLIELALREALREVLNAEAIEPKVELQATRSEFDGDYTLVVFPWIKQARCKPEVLAKAIGERIATRQDLVRGYNVVKGFLNLSVSDSLWLQVLASIPLDGSYGRRGQGTSGRTVVVEFSSPNTNKPQHLGHIRNNLLGHSISEILKAVGDKVYKANLINDRGIHICKSMVAWLRYGNGETPESTGIKGDHLVGDYYVRFDKEYKKEIETLKAEGKSQEEAEAQAPILLEAQAMLRKWEANDKEVRTLWERMNQWVYDGFRSTYRMMGISFDKLYFESQTYLLGKSLVEQGLQKGVFYRRDDGSVWIDLRSDGLDEKLLLRQDGTSVYMTQDLGTAVTRQKEFGADMMMYVVGNEQEYHFQVLKLILSKLGYEWAAGIYHLSYGMVFLPEGKMKSREGTVVDADDLMESLVAIAQETADTLGKLAELSESEQAATYRQVGLAALKYMILKVDPKRNITFDPKESIDFNGNTGPFLQYTHARACSVLARLAPGDTAAGLPEVTLSGYERTIIRRLTQFPSTLESAAKAYSPALVANYLYEVAREFNQFYHELPIAKEPNSALRQLRTRITTAVRAVLASGMALLGIEAPVRM